MTKRVEEMSAAELFDTFPPGVAQLRKVRPGEYVIEEAPRQPWPRPVAAAYARANKAQRAEQRIRRAAELTQQGLTARAIGEIVGREENQVPFPVTTVRSWRRKAREKGWLPPS